MASINSLMGEDGSDEYYNEHFRNCIEDHLQYLNKDGNYTVVNFDNGTAYKYENDFIGLLISLNIPKRLHWITLRLNGLTSPIQYDGTVNFVKTPTESILEELRTTWVATYG